MSATEKPRLKLVGRDGNAYAILGAAQRAAQKAKWPRPQIDEMLREATSSNYDHLLATVCKHFDVY